VVGLHFLCTIKDGTDTLSAELKVFYRLLPKGARRKAAAVARRPTPIFEN